MKLERLKAFKHKTLLAAFLAAGALITWGGFHNELKPHETRAQSSPYQCPATQAVTGQYSNTGQTCGWVYPSAAPAGDLGGTWIVQLVTGINGLTVPVSTPYLGTNASGQLIAATPPSAQVNSDWNASSGVAQILNKPTFQPPDLTGTGTVTAATIVVSGCSATSTIAVTGAQVAHRVDVQNTDGTLPATGVNYQGAVTSAGTVSIRQCSFLGIVLAAKAVTVTVGQ